MTRALICVVLLSAAALAQPKFDVADVHVSPHSAIPGVKGPFFGDDRYELRDATMVDLINAAYGIDPERVYGGPNWLEYDRFDVIAIAPKGSTPETRKLMLQSLLADRFKLALHKDSKPMTAYKLTAGKNPKLQESSGGGAGCENKMDNMSPPGPPNGEGQQIIQLPTFVYTCRGETMAAFAQALANAPAANQFLDNKPVVDATELSGAFDFTFRYTLKPPANLPPNISLKGESITLTDAVEKQLGLKLELSTAPMPVVMVDAANKPTENPPDVAKSFPPIPDEFDVAEIKPSPPSAPGQFAQPEIKNGRVIIPGMNLHTLIWLAWDIAPNDEIVGAPKWIDSEQFDLIAKAPPGVALGDLTPMINNNRGSFPLNVDALRPMLRNLLIERFKLKVHMEDRPTSTYVLVAVKPKLQKADPNGRTKWENGPGTDGKDPRKANPVLGRLVTCHNMNMAQFAQLLRDIAPGYIRNPVIDATGLEGNWDFTFYFSGAGQGQGGGRRGDGPQAGPGGADAASDPTGAISLLDALPKQLGLKLEMQKRPMPTLVIDHIEQKPTEN